MGIELTLIAVFLAGGLVGWAVRALGQYRR